MKDMKVYLILWKTKWGVLKRNWRYKKDNPELKDFNE